jgi:hypothetical protein
MRLPKRAPLPQQFKFPAEGSALQNFEDINANLPLVNENILIDEVDEYFQKQVMNPSETMGAESENYWGSEYQKNVYDEFKIKDKIYERFILQKYGSYQNFALLTRAGDAENVFDPFTDFKFDVTIITKNKYYKTDHISPFELIRESLYGICSVDYRKTNGQSDKIIGTLYKKYINPANIEERSNFFFPLRGNRIVLWNMVKQDWSSFYMSRVVRFVRDDSTGIE